MKNEKAVIRLLRRREEAILGKENAVGKGHVKLWAVFGGRLAHPVWVGL